VSLIPSLRTHKVFEGLSFQKFLFWARKKRQEERFLIRKKSSRAIRVILYTRILARILLARTTRAQTNLFVSVSLEREREKIEKEREKSLFFVSVCVCVCV
jgi:hypothetical protein